MILNHLENPFLNSKISDDNFNKLVKTHLERLKANNSNKTLDLLIDKTSPLLASYLTLMETESSADSSKSGQTVFNNQAMENLIDYILRKEGVIADVFYKTTPTYKEFFPKGKLEYSQATKSKIELIAKRFVKVAGTYKEALGGTIEREAQALLDIYTSSRTGQLQFIGKVKGLSGEGKINRVALATQLYKNLLLLLLANVSNTTEVKKYFDESFIKKTKKIVAKAAVTKV